MEAPLQVIDEHELTRNGGRGAFRRELAGHNLKPVRLVGGFAVLWSGPFVVGLHRPPVGVGAELRRLGGKREDGDERKKEEGAHGFHHRDTMNS
jgi:hypothetical protein